MDCVDSSLVQDLSSHHAGGSFHSQVPLSQSTRMAVCAQRSWHMATYTLHITLPLSSRYRGALLPRPWLQFYAGKVARTRGFACGCTYSPWTSHESKGLGCHLQGRQRSWQLSVSSQPPELLSVPGTGVGCWAALFHWSLIAYTIPSANLMTLCGEESGRLQLTTERKTAEHSDKACQVCPDSHPWFAIY